MSFIMSRKEKQELEISIEEIVYDLFQVAKAWTIIVDLEPRLPSQEERGVWWIIIVPPQGISVAQSAWLLTAKLAT